MSAQNSHLNLFRHYAASDDHAVLENNLTRALALCLQHDALFLYALLGAIVGEEELRSHLHLTDLQDRLTVDVQQSVRNLAPCTTLYAVALTETELSLAGYDTLEPRDTEAPITDLTIRYKDVLVLVEVKPSAENCLAQLKGQVQVYQQVQGDEQATSVQVKALSWAQVVRLAADTRNLRQLVNQPSPYTADFVQFIQYYFPKWDEVLYFKVIPFIQAGGINEAALYKRLHYIQQQAFGDQLKWFSDRVAMPIDELWASEVITHLEQHDGKPYVVVNVWPANTKSQGWSIFGKSLAWADRTELTVGNQTYEVTVTCRLKFSHFNKYIFLIPVNADFMSWEAFNTYAGKWDRDDWPKLEELLDRDTNRDWRSSESTWLDYFVNTDRNYTAIAPGYEVSVYLPYAEFQALDTSTEKWQPVAQKISAVVQALRDLINNPVVPVENSPATLVI